MPLDILGYTKAYVTLLFHDIDRLAFRWSLKLIEYGARGLDVLCLVRPPEHAGSGPPFGPVSPLSLLYEVITDKLGAREPSGAWRFEWIRRHG